MKYVVQKLDEFKNNEINYEEIYQNLIFEYGVRSSVICGYDFEDLTLFSFRYVKETIPNLMEQNNVLEIVKEGLKEKGKKFTEATDEELGAFYLWIVDEIKRIAELERDTLYRPTKPEHIAAGIENLNIFEGFNVVDALMEKYGWKEGYVWGKRYDKIYRIQLRGRMIADFNEKLAEIEKKKSKK